MTITRSADNVLIGWFWGTAPLGLYSRAINLLFLPVRQLNGPARNVAVPTLCRLQDDPERMARFYLRLANVIVWITAPIFGFLFVAATPVIVLTLGSKWRAAGPVFQILAVFALGQLLYESLVWLLISRGQSQRLLKLVLIMCPIAVGSYAIGLPFGIRGVALSGTLVMLLIFPWILKFSFRGTTLTLRRVGSRIMCPIMASLAGVAAGELAARFTDALPVIEQILFIAVAYAAGSALLLLVKPIRNELREILRLLPRSRGSLSERLAGALD